jgi:hypothetical protein
MDEQMSRAKKVLYNEGGELSVISVFPLTVLIHYCVVACKAIVATGVWRVLYEWT